MTTDSNHHGAADQNDPAALPNSSPDLEDAIRSIDAIGENAWGKDDDEDVSRAEPAAPDGVAQEGTAPDSTEGNPDAP